MKRKLALIMTAIVLTASFTSCGKTTEAEATTETVESVVEETVETIESEEVEETIETTEEMVETTEETVETTETEETTETTEATKESKETTKEATKESTSGKEETKNTTSNSELSIPNSELNTTPTPEPAKTETNTNNNNNSSNTNTSSNNSNSNSELSIPNSELQPESTPAPTPTPTPEPVATPTPAPAACDHANTSEVYTGQYDKTVAGGCYISTKTFNTVCSSCGAVVSTREEGYQTVHDGVLVTPGKTATCTEDGYSPTYTCSCGACGITGGAIMPAIGHNYKTYCTGEVSEDGNSVRYISMCTHCDNVEREWWE